MGGLLDKAKATNDSETKEVETSRVTAPYPPALEMVVPNLT